MEENNGYILLVIQNGSIPVLTQYNSGSTQAENWNAATAAFHQEMGYRHESRTSTVCVIFNYDGNELKRDAYLA